MLEQKQQQIKSISLGIKKFSHSSDQSNKTELERCPVELHDSANLQEDDIRESLAMQQK